MFAIIHPEKGIYLGKSNGLPIWSKINGVGHKAAVLFEDEDQIEDDQPLRHLRRSIEINEGIGTDFVFHAVSGELQSQWTATRRELEEAGLGDLVGGMAGATIGYVITHPELGVYCGDMADPDNGWTKQEDCKLMIGAATLGPEAAAEWADRLSARPGVAPGFGIAAVALRSSKAMATKRDLERSGLGHLVASMADVPDGAYPSEHVPTPELRGDAEPDLSPTP